MKMGELIVPERYGLIELYSLKTSIDVPFRRDRVEFIQNGVRAPNL